MKGLFRESVGGQLEKILKIIHGTLFGLWNQIIEDKNHHFIVNVKDNQIISSCTCIIIPNLTINTRPYALIENVVTDKNHRGKGYASECLEYAKNISIKQNCYNLN